MCFQDADVHEATAEAEAVIGENKVSDEDEVEAVAITIVMAIEAAVTRVAVIEATVTGVAGVAAIEATVTVMAPAMQVPIEI